MLATNSLGNTNIVICDSDAGSRRAIEGYLASNGCQVIAVDCAERLECIVSAEQADAVVLDLGVSGSDGLSLARRLAAHSDIGIIALIPADDCIERICSLEAGADDCISKPVEPRELLARLRAVIRRLGRGRQSAQLAETDALTGTVPIGALVLDMAARRLRDRSGREVPITEMEFSLLKTFIQNPGKALNRDELAELAYGRTWTPFDRSLDIRISRLRRKIEQDPARPEVILTVRGIGYRFEGRRAA